MNGRRNIFTSTWVSRRRYQKGKPSLDLNETRDDGVLRCSAWHQLDHQQTICTRSREVITPTPHHSFLHAGSGALPDPPTNSVKTLNANKNHQSREIIKQIIPENVRLNGLISSPFLYQTTTASGRA